MIPLPSAIELAESIRLRRSSAVDVLEAHLTRIRELNPSLNAFVEVRDREARAQAQAADESMHGGDRTGPLHGVPITIKSSIAVAGCKLEAGSPTRKGLVADRDAPLVHRLKQAGAIVLGTTNCPEMLMAYDTENALYGRTNSFYDVDRTPGGSSGGEAAAISSGMSAAGVGSDGGGSIRVPAHFSGICGLKPTPGRIPATGHYPESLGPFALLGVVGPMARTVADLRLMFDIMQGEDRGDTLAAPVPLRPIDDAQLAGIRIGIMEEHPECPVTPETKAAVRSAAAALEATGIATAPFMSDVFSEAHKHWWTLFVRLGGELILPIFEGRERETSSIMQYARHEAPPTKIELLAAWFGRDELRLKLFREMQDTPVLLMPVCAVPAYKHGERKWDINGQNVDYMQAMMYTQWFNLLGMPAVVVPAGRSPEGLPIGVQIVGLPYSEELLLAIAAVIEQQLGKRQ
ncbi:MAG TPA: amidase [Terriglobales bacterium]